ncbi:homoserine kinase [Bacillus sp. SCS-151]|uniref:homoserine kinase n=1 Tax=Nanhaiella sioensis TaxID=3115293 RepID=UPI0039799ED0
MNERIVIKVPGSTSNLGPGFDSIGLAVSRYLTLEVQRSTQWLFHSLTDELRDIPTGKDNLIFQVAQKVADIHEKELTPCYVDVTGEIPLARGLGSSAAAIVAGIELANVLCDLHLTNDEKLRFASLYEGHPDNVGASIYGGLIIGSHRQHETDIIAVHDFDVDIVVVIPGFELKTAEARSVLPSDFAFSKAVEASSISNVLISSLLTKNWTLAGKMMELDLFHQPYRSKLVPDIDEISSCARRYGSFGTALSGAGPTIICFAEKGKGANLQKSLQSSFSQHKIEFLSVDNQGSTVVQTSKEKEEVN